MEAYIPMGLPILALAILGVLMREKTMWQWGLAVLLSPLLFIFIVTNIDQSSQVNDTEYLGAYMQAAIYYEPWDEEVPCTHMKPCTHSYTCPEDKPKPESSDKKSPSKPSSSSSKSSGKRSGLIPAKDASLIPVSYDPSKWGVTLQEIKTCYKHANDGPEHAYDVDYHEATWSGSDSNGNDYSFTRGEFEELAQRWQKREFVAMHRSYHSINGNAYRTNWDNKEINLEPITMTSTYVNKVPASNSVYRFVDISPEEKVRYGLFDYPPVPRRNQKVILGEAGTNQLDAEFKFQVINSLLGKPLQIHVFVCIFHNQPLDAALKQEQLWQGGNKNELVICIGIDDAYAVQWCKAFAWDSDTKSLGSRNGNGRLKIDIREFVAEQKTLDLVGLADWLRPQIESTWVRREFTELNNSLHVPLTGTALLWIWILTTLLSAGGVIGNWLMRR